MRILLQRRGGPAVPRPEPGPTALEGAEGASLFGGPALPIFLLLFAALLFIELPGSDLFEPDEARYAEVGREMLESGDWLVSRLNYVEYLEKPPFLYWLEAGSMKLLGLNSYAVRLPGRLACLGVALLMVLGLRKEWGREGAVLAGLVYLSAPLPFILHRLALTDGVLTFAMTLTLVALHRFLLDREEGRKSRWPAVWTGVGSGLAVLTKGAVGIALPGLTLLLWCLFRRRWKRIPEILLSPATPVCLALTVPYFLAMERAAPGFSYFFWVHEHLLRYATPDAGRPGPPYYFLVTFLLGFLPWTLFLAPHLRRALRSGPSELWFGLYALVVLGFFSLSSSKLIPYVLPMFPAAAILCARWLSVSGKWPSAGLLVHALAVTGGAAFCLWVLLQGGTLSRYGLLPGAAVLLPAIAGCAFAAAVLCARQHRAALWTFLSAWALISGAAIIAQPRLATDRSGAALARSAKEAAGGEAAIVAYGTYLHAFPWVLGKRVATYGWQGELAFGSQRGDQSGWFLTRDDFWRDWGSRRKMVVLARAGAGAELAASGGKVVQANRTHLVVKNF